MENWMWTVSFLLIGIGTIVAEDGSPNFGFNGGGYSPFGQSSFPFFSHPPFNRFGPRNPFGSRYPFGRDPFSSQGPGFYPPRWNFNGGFGPDYLERASNQAMCLRSMTNADETKVNECIVCFDNSQIQRGFSRSFDLSNYTKCAKNYLGDDYSSCTNNMPEADSGTSASAIDVFRFRGCYDYTRWTRAVDNCQQLYPENQSGFYQCMLTANRIRPPVVNPVPLPTVGPPQGLPPVNSVPPPTGGAPQGLPPANTVRSPLPPSREPPTTISQP